MSELADTLGFYSFLLTIIVITAGIISAFFAIIWTHFSYMRKISEDLTNIRINVFTTMENSNRIQTDTFHIRENTAKTLQQVDWVRGNTLETYNILHRGWQESQKDKDEKKEDK